MITRFIARLYWAVSRWDLRTQPPSDRPAVILGAPHTSNWDFIMMLAITWSQGVTFRWLGKKSLFKGPAGPIMKAIGGVPVDRAAPGGLVSSVVEQVRSGEVFSIVIAPEGTRNSTGYWKSGFYRIALEAGMPVTLGYVDRTTMTAGLGPTIELTGDIHTDMDTIREFYADKAGFRPERRNVPRLREEDSASDG